MRIATTTLYQNALESITDRQAKLLRAQDELSTGRKLLRPSDDPAGAAQAERLRAQQSRMLLAQRMNDFARSMVGQAESTLATAGELMQSLRERFVQAGNGALGAADRASIALQMQAQRDELLRLANRSDGAGGYLFGGLGSSTAPFSPATADYLAPSGEQQVGLDAAVPTSLDGREVFLSVPTAAGPDSVFRLLDQAIAVLEDPASDAAQVAAAVGAGLDTIDGALDRLLAKRTELGEHLKMLDSRDALSMDAGLAVAARLSGLVDADYAKSASDFTRHQAVLQAAMKTYASIGGLSLFDYL